MTSFTTFYLSRIIDKKLRDSNGQLLGVIKDLLIDADYSHSAQGKPLVTGIKIKRRKEFIYLSFETVRVTKTDAGLKVVCSNPKEMHPDSVNVDLHLADVVLDKQIVDLNGRKLVRVNDIRLVSLSRGTFVLAVDIGIEGLLRRIGIAKPLKSALGFFGRIIPAKYIIWEDVEAIDFSNYNIKLSKIHSKLHTLHPSDLADIIEELDKKTQMHIFSSLNEEQAADVLEELDPEAQIHIIESFPVERMADVLEKMPADEVADILDALEDEKAELLLSEMENESSQEVRELLEYPANTVGSIMISEVLTFRENSTVNDVINELRSKKPEKDEMYNLFVTDEKDKLIATFSLRDLILSMPDVHVNEIMKPSPVHLHDYQKIDDIAEFISKYNLLAIPVIDDANVLQGMVVVDDVVEDLLNKRRTNK